MLTVRPANHQSWSGFRKSTVAAHTLQLIDRLDRRLTTGGDREEAGEVAVNRRQMTFHRQTQTGGAG